MPVSPATKRARSSPVQADDDLCLCRFKNLENATFPRDICALPHVLEQINIFSMSEYEAVMEATKKRNVEWLKNLLQRCECEVLDALSFAAENDDAEIVKLLVETLDDNEKLDAAHDVLKAVLKTSTERGNTEIVRVVLPLLDDEYCYKAWDVIYIAAARGHVDILKYAAAKADDGYFDEPRSHTNVAVLRAIFGGHIEAANFLISRYYREWDLKDAFVVALAKELNTVVECIYDVQRDVALEQSFEDFFIDLADNGCTNAVKYLFDRGHIEVEWINRAFTSASIGGHTEVLSFLLQSGRVSTDACEKAFHYAALFGRDNAISFLYRNSQVSQNTMKRAFEHAASPSISKFLYEKLQAPTDSVITAFRHAALCMGSRNNNRMSDENRTPVLQFLCTTEHISSELLIEAFVSAAEHGRLAVLKALYKEKCILPEVVHEAFERAIEGAYTQGVKFLVDKLEISVPDKKSALLNT